MSMSPRICVHHVGGRGGSQVFPPLPAFDAEFVNVLYDADPTCVDEVRRLHGDRKAQVMVFPYCLGAKAGERDFHHLLSPYTSSLLPPEPNSLDCYLPFADMDYWLREAFAVRAVERLAVHNLDELLADERVTAAPDLLSLDTQGSELDILVGAERALAGAVGVIAEVEFLPMYAGQPLYGEIARHLVNRGFLFAQFGKSLDVAFARLPLGARGRRFMATCDAVFLRDPRSVLVLADRTPAEKKLILRKLAFVSVVQGFLEHALFALLVESDDPAVRDANLNADTAWLRFVADFHAAASGGDGQYPPTYAEKRRRVLGERDASAKTDDEVWPVLDEVCSGVAAKAAEIAGRTERLATLMETHGLNDAAGAVRQQTMADLERFRVPRGHGVQESGEVATVLRKAG